MKVTSEKIASLKSLRSLRSQSSQPPQPQQKHRNDSTDHDGASSAQGPVASTASNNNNNGTALGFEKVGFHEQVGTLILSPEKLEFQPDNVLEDRDDDDDASVTKAWSIQSIQRHQISPPNNKFELKVVISKHHYNQVLSFAFPNRYSLERIHANLNRLERQAHDNENHSHLKPPKSISTLPQVPLQKYRRLKETLLSTQRKLKEANRAIDELQDTNQTLLDSCESIARKAKTFKTTMEEQSSQIRVLQQQLQLKSRLVHQQQRQLQQQQILQRIQQPKKEELQATKEQLKGMGELKERLQSQQQYIEKLENFKTALEIEHEMDVQEYKGRLEVVETELTLERQTTERLLEERTSTDDIKQLDLHAMARELQKERHMNQKLRDRLIALSSSSSSSAPTPTTATAAAATAPSRMVMRVPSSPASIDTVTASVTPTSPNDGTCTVTTIKGRTTAPSQAQSLLHKLPLHQVQEIETDDGDEDEEPSMPDLDLDDSEESKGDQKQILSDSKHQYTPPQEKLDTINDSQKYSEQRPQVQGRTHRVHNDSIDDMHMLLDVHDDDDVDGEEDEDVRTTMQNKNSIITQEAAKATQEAYNAKTVACRRREKLKTNTGSKQTVLPEDAGASLSRQVTDNANAPVNFTTSILEAAKAVLEKLPIILPQDEADDYDDDMDFILDLDDDDNVNGATAQGNAVSLQVRDSQSNHALVPSRKCNPNDLALVKRPSGTSISSPSHPKMKLSSYGFGCDSWLVHSFSLHSQDAPFDTTCTSPNDADLILSCSKDEYCESLTATTAVKKGRPAHPSLPVPRNGMIRSTQQQNDQQTPMTKHSHFTTSRLVLPYLESFASGDDCDDNVNNRQLQLTPRPTISWDGQHVNATSLVNNNSSSNSSRPISLAPRFQQYDGMYPSVNGALVTGEQNARKKVHERQPQKQQENSLSFVDGGKGQG